MTYNIPKNIPLLMILVICALMLGGCVTKTRTMQEQTRLDLVAQTPIGEIRVEGNISRTQNEQTEFKMKMPALLQTAISGATSYLAGATGIVGLGYAWYATRQKRLKLEQAEVEKESLSAELAAKRDYYLRELCRGVGKFLTAADPAAAEQLRTCLRESLSRDTRDAIRDFI